MPQSLQSFYSTFCCLHLWTFINQITTSMYLFDVLSVISQGWWCCSSRLTTDWQWSTVLSWNCTQSMNHGDQDEPIQTFNRFALRTIWLKNLKLGFYPELSTTCDKVPPPKQAVWKQTVQKPLRSTKPLRVNLPNQWMWIVIMSKILTSVGCH